MEQYRQQLTTHELQAAKAVRQMARILGAFGLIGEDWTPKYEADLIHDVGVMIGRQDITGLKLEIVGTDGKILYEHREAFGGDGQATGRRADPARGTEIPVIPRHLITNHRITTEWVHETPAALLNLSWTTVPRLTRTAGASFASAHTAAITGGRTAGEVFVGNEARRHGTLMRWGARRYGFIADDRLGQVHVHEHDCQPGLALRPGLRLDYLVVQTPRGFQARDVRLAAGEAWR